MKAGTSIIEDEDFGPKPQALWLDVDKLVVDPDYQRSVQTKRGQALVGKISAGFRWARCGAPTVSRRDGKDWVVDGQHRVEGARGRKIRKLLCLVYSFASKAEEAAVFAGVNGDRVAVSPFAVHHAMVAAEDPDAVAIAACCRKAGVEIPRYPIPVQSLAPQQTLALGTIKACITRLGGGATVSALETLRKAFPDEGGGLRAHLIAGLAAVIAPRPKLPKAMLQQALAARGLAALEGEILKTAMATKGKRAAIAEAEILKLLPVELRKLPPESKAPAAVSANKANAGRVLMPASLNTARPAPRASTGRSARAADEAAIAEHIAKKGVTKLPPAAAAATTAVFKSELPEIPRSGWVKPPKNQGAEKARALKKISGAANHSASARRGGQRGAFAQMATARRLKKN